MDVAVDMIPVWAQGLLGWGRGELKEKRGIQSWNTKGLCKFRVGNRHPTSLCKALYHIRVSDSLNKAGISGFLVLFSRAGHPCADTRGSPEWTNMEAVLLSCPQGAHGGSRAQNESPWPWGLLEFGSTVEGLECPNPALLTVQRNNDHCSGTI